ncbi:sporulation protein [Halorussus caseinilyticus]|uniref:Sporulation protein n=1 Tax=Halorussus caseinilyticus TaxID=3034025 RepID=A0ABD5WTN3_9EURY|nr:sporulation protein [Halorussus sp. DT72]
MLSPVATVASEDASVEVAVESKTLTVGGTDEVEIGVSDTSGEFRVESLDLEIGTYCRTSGGYERVPVERFALADGLSADSGFTTTRVESVSLPHTAPTSIGSVDAWARTTIATADSTETRETYVNLHPSPTFLAVFDAVIDAGFAFRDIECYRRPDTDRRRFDQALAFVPRSGPYERAMDELLLVVHAEPDTLEVYAAADATYDELRPVGETTPTVLPADADEKRCAAELDSLLGERFG